MQRDLQSSLCSHSFKADVMTNTFECGWKAHYTSMTLHSAAQCNEVKKCEIFNKLRLVFLTDKFFYKTRYLTLHLCSFFYFFAAWTKFDSVKEC